MARRPRGNLLFSRCLEEVERHVTPSRAARILLRAIAEVGATPEDVTVGHCVRALDISLPQALDEHCDEAEAAAIIQELTQVLDQVAGTYFRV